MRSGVYATLDLQVQYLTIEDLAKEYSNDVEEYAMFKGEKIEECNNAGLTYEKLNKINRELSV